MNKRLLIGLSTLTVITGVIIGGLKIGQAASQYTDPAVNQTLQNHTERLDNHEARITNTESNVKDLQDKTSTPSTSTVFVPQVVTPASDTKTPSPPGPILVTKSSYSVVLTDGGSSFCDLTYSDGTNSHAEVHGITSSSINQYGQTQTNFADHCSDYIGHPKN